MVKAILIALIPLSLLILLPVWMRPVADSAPEATARLVIVTPHNEAIRYEFSRAFRDHCRKTLDLEVVIDWRSPGGTSEIARYIDDQFKAAFRRYWQDAQSTAWSEPIARGFNNRKLNEDTAVPEAWQARQVFLESNVGIGIDLFFGGGEYDMRVQAQKGHAVDAGLLQSHGHWLTDDVIPAIFTGERFYDLEGRYYGTCLSAFGICYNIDRLAALKDPTPPECWLDLGAPRFLGQLGVADPTKSGSITKCFEMLIQEQMADARDPAKGWEAGLNLIKRIGGNSRYVTDSSSKIPHDVGKGDALAGMCIDFYGRSEAEFTALQSGQERLRYITPRGGSSISADPMLMLRGAPNRELAVAFITFVLSKDGQRLWNYRVGTPGGPKKYALRRLPVRRDMYTDADRAQMSDAAEKPFEAAAEFAYNGALTGRYFGLIRELVKVMIIDSRPELLAAWEAIIAAGGPGAVPEAMARFNALPVYYDAAADSAARLDTRKEGVTPLSAIQARRKWADFFRSNYREAEALAKAQAP
jgi:ABC-type Fe3+ transport system substrate-binding protein